MLVPLPELSSSSSASASDSLVAAAASNSSIAHRRALAFAFEQAHINSLAEQMVSARRTRGSLDEGCSAARMATIQIDSCGLFVWRLFVFASPSGVNKRTNSATRKRRRTHTELSSGGMLTTRYCS